jgi:hypothetical protein
MEQEHPTAPTQSNEPTQPASSPTPEGTANTPPASAAPVKKNSHNPSVTGIVLAGISLGLSAFGNLLVHAHATKRDTPTIDQKVGQAVDNGVSHVLGAIFGVPFLVGGITLAIISAILLALRLRKIKATGIVLTILAVLIIIWSFSIAIGGFDYIRAKPAN